MNDDEKPVNCPKCGCFMKVTYWTNEGSGEQETFDCNNCNYSMTY